MTYFIKRILDSYKKGGLKLISYKTLDRIFPKDEGFYKRLEPEKYPYYLNRIYYRRFYRMLNLESPETFNEKIQWMKLYDSTPEKTILADKYLVRSWIKEMIGEQYLIPLLGVWDSFDEIDFSKLPDAFVLKCNHGCGMNAIVRDKSQINIPELREQFSVWMNTDYAFVNGFEMHYHGIERKIIGEKYIEQKNGLTDYKIHCFNGVPKIISIVGNRNPETHYALDYMVYCNWSKCEYMYKNAYEHYEACPEKPERLDDMLRIARKLGSGFIYVRIDLYEVEGEIYFGEMTFTPASGLAEWNSSEADQMLGSWIDLKHGEETTGK